MNSSLGAIGGRKFQQPPAEALRRQAPEPAGPSGLQGRQVELGDPGKAGLQCPQGRIRHDRRSGRSGPDLHFSR